MDHKCAYCGADQEWDQERERYYCSDKCWRLRFADGGGLSEEFAKHYRILIRAVQRLRKEVAGLKAINREAYEAYMSTSYQQGARTAEGPGTDDAGEPAA
jgi:hypothetical protein